MDSQQLMANGGSPLAAILSGYTAGRGEADIRMEQKKAQENDILAKQMAYEKDAAAAAAAAAGREAMSNLVQKGIGATRDDYARALVANPGYASAIDTVYNGYQSDRQNAEKNFAVSLFSALKSDPAIARQMISERLSAAESSGDTETANTMRGFLQISENPDGIGVLKNTIGLSLAQVLPKDAFAAVMGEPSKTDTEAFNQEEKLRKEFTSAAAPYFKSIESYNRMISSPETGAGDLSLIYNFMRLLDPNSVVREGEFATAQNAGGVPAAVINMYNNVVNGELLPENVRSDFKNTAKNIVIGAERSVTDAKKRLMPVVEYYELSPDRVFGNDIMMSKSDSQPGSVASVPDEFAKNPEIVDAMKKYGVTAGELYNAMSPDERAWYK